jgi:hypothetical protein
MAKANIDGEPKKTRAARAAELQAKRDAEIAARRAVNIPRLWRLLERCWNLNDAIAGYGIQEGVQGLHIRYMRHTPEGPYNPEKRYPDETFLHVDSDDWEFEFVEESLDDMENQVRLKNIEEEKRQAVLATLSDEQRKLLGFPNWKAK